jgi:hypothetical protein
MTLTASPPGVPIELEEQVLFEEQALFKEARRRRRRRWMTTVAVLVLASAGAVAVVASSSGGGSDRALRSSGSTRQILAGPFAGTWQVKYYDVRINSDGAGTATWPIKSQCGRAEARPGAPCDTVNPTTGIVHDGGHAEIQIVSSADMTAEGMVSGSTEPSVLPDGQASFRVSNDDVIYITPTTPTSSSPFGRESFCGPRAMALSFTQQQAEHIDCGT